MVAKIDQALELKDKLIEMIPEGGGLLANPTVWNHGVFLMASFIGTFYLSLIHI